MHFSNQGAFIVEQNEYLIGESVVCFGWICFHSYWEKPIIEQRRMGYGPLGCGFLVILPPKNKFLIKTENSSDMF